MWKVTLYFEVYEERYFWWIRSCYPEFSSAVAYFPSNTSSSRTQSNMSAPFSENTYWQQTMPYDGASGSASGFTIDNSSASLTNALVGQQDPNMRDAPASFTGENYMIDNSVALTNPAVPFFGTSTPWMTNNWSGFTAGYPDLPGNSDEVAASGAAAAAFPPTVYGAPDVGAGQYATDGTYSVYNAGGPFATTGETPNVYTGAALQNTGDANTAAFLAQFAALGGPQSVPTNGALCLTFNIETVTDLSFDLSLQVNSTYLLASQWRLVPLPLCPPVFKNTQGLKTPRSPP